VWKASRPVTVNDVKRNMGRAWIWYTLRQRQCQRQRHWWGQKSSGHGEQYSTSPTESEGKSNPMHTPAPQLPPQLPKRQHASTEQTPSPSPIPIAIAHRWAVAVAVSAIIGRSDDTAYPIPLHQHRIVVRGPRNRAAPRPLTAHPATVNDEALSRHIITSPRREEDDRALKVRRGAPPARGDTLEDLARTNRVGDEGLVHLSTGQH
jgi:hypothetical protein